jgi:aminoglycoside phosphotransferase (APT) family kinase protein
VPLAARTTILGNHLQQLEGLVDRNAVLDLWERTLAAQGWPGPPLWIHGDLHPGNLLVCGGRLSAVIDFGDLAAGDPATDLSLLWMLSPSSARSIFRESGLGTLYAVDDYTLTRARGWALALGLAYLVGSQNGEPMRGLGLATINAALSDE